MNIQFAIKKIKFMLLRLILGRVELFHLFQKQKVTFAKIISRIMTGEKLSKFNPKDKSKGMFAVKEAVFYLINFLTVIYFWDQK